MDVQISLLGGFSVSVDGREVPGSGWTRRSASSLVKLLALAPGRRLHREQVLDALWPDLAPEDASPRLHTAAHYARRALGERSGLVLRGEVLTLLPDADVQVDVERFLALARVALAGGTAADVDAALAAHPGPLLPDDLFEAWTGAERDRVRQVHLDLLRAGRRWEDLLREEPADEQAHLALMRELADRGDRRGALRQFERLDRALRAELGVGPSAEAVALRDRLTPAAESPPPAARPPRLVGRRPVLERLDRALQEIRTGRGTTALVHGLGGAGTSAVLAWVRARAAAGGARTGAGGTSAAEGGWPYAPVLEALSDLCRAHPTLLDGLDDAYRDEIERALRGGELTWSGEGAHQRLFVSVAELLRLAAAGAGAVLTVDDLHDADEGSLRLLHYLARVAATERVVLVAGHHDVPEDTRLGRMRASLVRQPSVADLPIPPLSPTGTAALLADHLGTPVDDRLVEEVYAWSGGLPQRVLQVHAGVGRGDTVPLPIERLLSACPPGTEDVLRRVAVAGTAVTTDEFVALAGTGEDEAFAVLDAALTTGLVQPAEIGFRFRSSRLRQRLIAGLPPHRLQRLHRDAAAALETLGAAPARIGSHLLHAGAAAAAVPHLLTAAESAAAVGAYRDALDLVEQVRDVATGADRARLLALRADLLLAVGDPAAVAAYREAAVVCVGDARRIVLARLAQACSMAGDQETAADALSGLETDGGPADGMILLARGHVAYFTGDIAAARAAADEARARLGDATDWRLLDLIALQGLIAHNDGQWFRRLRHELQRTREAPTVATAVFDAHLCVAEYLLYGPTPYTEVMELGRALRETAQRAGAVRAVAFASALTGEAALLSGDLPTAEHDLLEAVDQHAEIGAAAGEAHSLQRLAELRVLQGDRAEARRLLQRALPLARWSPIAMHLMQRIDGTTVLAADTPEDAYAAARRAEATVGPEDECHFCQVMVSVPCAIACADVGDVDRAQRHLATAEESAALWHGTAWQGAVLEARAHLVRAQGDEAGWRSLLLRAAECFDTAGQPLDADRCRTAQTPTGSATARAGQRLPT
ncbi:AAA family ATPase [Modestobacter marinus]|uniref:AAA family ATPase n=1 Tax=Modestobacter marinus TaxID=477641 RepID=UPI001C973ABC|nr:AAA family ATPase [Modestobacter marinus]